MTPESVAKRKGIEKIFAAMLRDYERQHPESRVVTVRVYHEAQLIPTGAIGPITEVVIHCGEVDDGR